MSEAARKATPMQLVFMTYAVVCSGAYGLEEMVSASGPGMAMLTLVALPILWGAPLALACAELASLHPVEGGYYRWARLAFGELVGFLAGWLVWLALFATNAAFAVQFANNLRYFVSLDGPSHFLVAAGLVWATTYLNHRGIVLVGKAAVVMTVLIFVPFVGLTVAGILHLRFNPLVPFVPPGRAALGAFLGGLAFGIWLYSGWEKLTVNAEEVEDPRRSFPLALAWAVPFVAASYVVPTLAALGALGDWKDWGEAHFTDAAASVGGPLLGAAMAAGGLVSNACLLLVTILGQARLPMVMAEDSLFPGFFTTTHPRFGTPGASLVVGGVVLTALCGLRLSSLVSLFSLVQVLAYMLKRDSESRCRAPGCCSCSLRASRSRA